MVQQNREAPQLQAQPEKSRPAVWQPPGLEQRDHPATWPETILPRAPNENEKLERETTQSAFRHLPRFRN